MLTVRNIEPGCTLDPAGGAYTLFRMARRNRVDPFGDLHAVPDHGLFTGNRGCLVNEHGELVRHHRGLLWITCVLEYKDWKSPLSAPRHWTPLFFLDDAVALAAGHRPCGLCRPAAYRSYKEAVSRARNTDAPLSAAELNRSLAADRLKPGRGMNRSTDRKTWAANIDRLPTGTVIVDDSNRACVVMPDEIRAFDFGGWMTPEPRPDDQPVMVLTPPTSVAALSFGYQPLLHPSVHELVAQTRPDRRIHT